MSDERTARRDAELPLGRLAQRQAQQLRLMRDRLRHGGARRGSRRGGVAGGRSQAEQDDGDETTVESHDGHSGTAR